MVPKDHQPRKFRLIIDLSAPMGGSVNEGIDPNLTSLTYPRVEDAVRLIKAAGPGASMAKLDLKAAYRHVPVHPDDQSLLAIRLCGTTYLDTALPFGLCSTPNLFTAMADGLAWCMVCEGISHFLHYLDDFFVPLVKLRIVSNHWRWPLNCARTWVSQWLLTRWSALPLP